MCGIFAYLSKCSRKPGEFVGDRELICACDQIQYRGPDDTKHVEITDRLFFGFHRLAINGLDHGSDEPLYGGFPDSETKVEDGDTKVEDGETKVEDGETKVEARAGLVLICNGEIYNYRKLLVEHDLVDRARTHNDCEAILLMYEKYGIEKTVRSLDGVFAFVLYDGRGKRKWLHVANDPIGIRPLYEGRTRDGSLAWASEPIALRDICQDYIGFFPPGCYQSIEVSLDYEKFGGDSGDKEEKKKGCGEVGGDDGEKEEDDGEMGDNDGEVGDDDGEEEVRSLGNLVGHAGKKEKRRYFQYEWVINEMEPPEIYPRYRELLESAVRKRMMGDRPIACLLSGGLDSSLISALVAKFMREKGEVDGKEVVGVRKLHTFSIGLPGSPDLKYAQMVSDKIGSIHHSIELSEEEFLAAIPEVIRAIQSFDTTTVRASVGNYLLGKHISENTDFKIILNGDVSEEINGSYFYSRFAPSDWAFFDDNVRLIREVHRYDVLRSARSMEHWGLEARTPFADKTLVNFVMSINPKYKRFGSSEAVFPMEKMLLRIACGDLLPPEVAWRPKMAFSDGVSKKERSWHEVINEWVDKRVTDDEWDEARRSERFTDPTPISKEAYWYRKIFAEHMGDRFDMAGMIAEYWMPRFIKATDPSARVLGAH